MKYRLIAPVTDATASRAARHIAVSHQAIGLVVATAEATMIVVGSAFGPMVYGWIAGMDAGEPHRAIDAGMLASLLYVSIARSKGLYRLPMLIEPVRHIGRISTACAYVLLSITAILFLLKIGSDFSR